MRNYNEQEQKLRFQMELEIANRIKELEKLNDELSDKYEEIIDGYIEKNKILTEALDKIHAKPAVVFPKSTVGDEAGAYLRADPVRIIIAECLMKV